MMKNKAKKTKKSTKDIIRGHLRENRGKEIPLAEIREIYNLGRTAISNAIKELKLRGEILDDRRPLRHGRYTVIWLAGDNVTEFFKHPNEDEENYEKRVKGISKQTEIEIKIEDFDETIKYLYSPDYKFVKFLKEIELKNYSQFNLVSKFIQPILYEVGKQWESGILTTGQEHLISTRLIKMIHELTPPTPETKYKGNLLLCVVEGDTHVINLLLLEMLLADKYKITNLGGSLPIRSLIHFITDYKDKHQQDFDWIFISITLPSHIGTLNRQIQAIRSVYPNFHKIAVGGQGIVGNENDIEEVDQIITSVQDLEAFISHMRN